MNLIYHSIITTFLLQIMYRKIRSKIMHIIIHTFINFSLCTEFHIALLQTKVFRSCLHKVQ